MENILEDLNRIGTKYQDENKILADKFHTLRKMAAKHSKEISKNLKADVDGVGNVILCNAQGVNLIASHVEVANLYDYLGGLLGK